MFLKVLTAFLTIAAWAALFIGFIWALVNARATTEWGERMRVTFFVVMASGVISMLVLLCVILSNML